MKAVGVVLTTLGVLCLAVAVSGASKAPNVSYLVGTFLPGLLFLIVGLKLGQGTKQKPGSTADGSDEESDAAESGPTARPNRGDGARSDRLKFSANLGVGCGILLMFLGSAVAQTGEEGLTVGLLTAFAGWAWEIWGCVNYMRWKGHSGWFGLFGYLLLPGLIILACFPNRRKQLRMPHGPGPIAEAEAARAEDQKPGYRYLLTLVPLGLLFVILGGVLVITRSRIDPAVWEEVTPSGAGFKASMPGPPRQEENAQDTPAGRVHLQKFTVIPKGKNELFMIVTIRFPEGVSRKLGGTEKLLELGRQNVLSASQGQLKSQQQITLKGRRGLELEVLPPKGAVIKVRIYATEDQVYQVSVHVPRIRLSSEDVQKFFDSFDLVAQPGS